MLGRKNLLLVGAVGLEVRVGEVSEGTSNEENGVEACTETGSIGALGGGAGGLGGRLGCRVAGLLEYN